MERKKQLLNDRGFSLVEMIVSILVTAIIMFGVGVFISTTRGTYQMVGTSAKLQEESLATQNFISELVMEADNYASFTETDVNCTNELGESFFGDIFVECIKAKNNDPEPGESDICYYFFIHAKKEGEKTGTLHYSKAADPSVFADSKIFISGTHELSFLDSDTKQEYIYDSVVNRYTLIADCMEEMKFNCSSAKNNGFLIHMECKLSFMDTEFVSDMNILTRNMH